MYDVDALLRLELETLWATDERGRIVSSRTDDAAFGPLLVVAGHQTGLCWAASVSVPTDLDVLISSALSRTRPAVEIGWSPDAAAGLVTLLSGTPGVGPCASPVGGPSWLIPETISRDLDVAIRTSRDNDADQVVLLLPKRDRHLRAPWALAVVDGRAAAVCETARSARFSAEAGVWTYEPFRRRGLGASVTAAWRGLLEDRTAFYSTSWDNLASQGVARRLGLQPIGQWWQVYRQGHTRTHDPHREAAGLA